jgi:Ca2+-binding EF-hand superfamily protein
MFDQTQIAEFKEAFSMIDHDTDGFIDKEDLKDMLGSLGIPHFSHSRTKPKR